MHFAFSRYLCEMFAELVIWGRERVGNSWDSYMGCDVGGAGLHSCGILVITFVSLLKRREFGVLLLCFIFLAKLVCVLSALS